MASTINGIVLNQLGTDKEYLGVSLVALDCYKCGVVFALSGEYDARRRKDHEAFYCPNGHANAYNGKTEAEKLREQLKQQEQATDRYRDWLAETRTDLATEKRQHAATKGKLTKTVNRIHAGVCPHCKRHFANVERHMTSQHKTETEQH